MISEEGLLFIEPIHPAASTPIVDHLTRKMAAAFRKARTDDRHYYLGRHQCICGANSTNQNYYLPNGFMTNSLCVHYVAYHRSEVPAHQLTLIKTLTPEEVEPTHLELAGICFLEDRSYLSRIQLFISRLFR
jgi:hypothetical protein